MSVLLPNNHVEQKLNKSQLFGFNTLIKAKVKELYKNNKEKEDFIIQDGPPYANGDIHVGHLLNKFLKDYYVKYMSIQGHKVRYSFGWDCHGLPIELKAKDLVGDLKENAALIAEQFKEKQKKSFQLFGIHSTEDDYLTMSEDYKSRELSLYNILYNQGSITEKYKPTWYSPTLKSVLSNSEIEYKDLEIESVYFFLHTIDNRRLLVWTTTEWSVAGNQAVCVSKDIEYIETADGIIMSKEFADNNYFVGESLTELPSHYYNLDNVRAPILYDDFVQEGIGTGLVHLCGGHSDDDFRILESNNIVSKNCTHKDLQEHIDSFELDENIVHQRVRSLKNVPVDWRESNRVYKVLTRQLYVDLDFIKVKENFKKIKMSGKDRARLGSTMFSRQEWCISRQRTWGVAIPNSADILDVWFDSGSAFLMYDKPADLYIEGTDQYRGWFQTSCILSALIDKIPSKRIMAHGFILDEYNNKLAKSKGTAVSVEELYTKYNPDVLRLWVLSSDYKNDIVFSEDSLKTAGKLYFKLRNFLRYLLNNLHRNQWVKVSLESLKLDKLHDKVEEHSNNLDIHKVVREITNYLNKYSANLTEDIKNTFYESSIDSEIRIDIENNFYTILVEAIDLLFPILPFLSIELETKLHELKNQQ